MGRLVTAEFRKVLTTNLWWALLIPTAVVAVVWSWVGSLLTTTVVDAMSQSTVLRRFGVDLGEQSWSVLFFARTINISAIFPMIFGALALSSEITRRTVTTSYLTAPNRGSLLGAKLITYAAWGAAYGVVVSGFASLGILLGSHPQQLPDATGWLLMALAGVLSCLLWTLLGVGVGALLGNSIAALLSLLIYTLLVENLIGLWLPQHWPGVLINGSADGLPGVLASQLLNDQLDTVQQIRLLPDSSRQVITDGIQGLAGARGAFDWWASGLIFAGWAAVFVVAGWLVSRTRDIT
ncbi:ABC transporter permease [Kutzneria albida]|uniref:Uncharacterized protein n=1 Tax=Kutzneria albida DSM 43870 TaxID=1449976 RepID=W5WKA5_9PSEU|nr:ABC transporter permease [Kutzneria albida]AHI01176.1 hypothetical protein KALB_7818 [Kutzneria albida DSM 43870]